MKNLEKILWFNQTENAVFCIRTKYYFIYEDGCVENGWKMFDAKSGVTVIKNWCEMCDPHKKKCV